MLKLFQSLPANAWHLHGAKNGDSFAWFVAFASSSLCSMKALLDIASLDETSDYAKEQLINACTLIASSVLVAIGDVGSEVADTCHNALIGTSLDKLFAVLPNWENPPSLPVLEISGEPCKALEYVNAVARACAGARKVLNGALDELGTDQDDRLYQQFTKQSILAFRFGLVMTLDITETIRDMINNDSRKEKQEGAQP